MLTLAAGDSVQFSTTNPIISNTNGLVVAQAFLYSPTVSTSVAWSVAKTQPDSASSSYLVFEGPIDILAYNVVFVNINSAWNALINEIIIPLTGIYFIDFNGYMCGKASGGDGNSGMGQFSANTYYTDYGACIIFKYRGVNR